MHNLTMVVRRLTGLGVFLLAAAPLAAQVGHPPGHSPYRDILHGSSWTLLAGSLGGNGGKLGIGPHHGKTYGVRYDFGMGGFIQAGLSVSYMDLERLIVDADLPPATRVSGPVKESVVLIEAGMEFNLTGAKTWHRLAPYVTGGLGYALGSSTKADTSGYTFGNRFAISPGAGIRIFLADRLHLRLEARRHFWKLKYPASYEDEPASLPGSTGNAVIKDGKLNEWASGWWLIGGIGFSF
jgi:opacity protein-like surface antigen